MAQPPADVVAEVANVTRSIMSAGRASLAAVYVHGSAVLGDFQPGRSDLDLLIVVDDGADDTVVDECATALAAVVVSCAIGIEASIVERREAARARPPWRFRSHVTTTPTDRKMVSGRGHPGDPDLALHYLVTRHAGWAALGPHPSSMFGELDRRLVLEHLATELRWASVEAPTAYGVLNACRALRYAHDSTICSKTDGGLWALEQRIEPHLVTAALAHRVGRGSAPEDDARAWVAAVAESLLRAPARDVREDG